MESRNSAAGRFKSILLVYSSKGMDTLKRAVKMARDHKAALAIIDVAGDLDEFRGLLPPAISEQDLKKAVSVERRAVIEDQLHSAGIAIGPPDIHIAFGQPAVEIIRNVLALQHDLVIKTAVGGIGISQRLFGNTAIKLLRKCPCPVWIAKPDSPADLNRILAAVDPMPTTDRSRHLNRQILETAAHLAQMEDAHLDILHCWHLPGESMLSSGRTRISASKLAKMRTLAEKVHRHKVIEFVESMSIEVPSKKLHILNGDPIGSILAFANREASDLIVIGTADKSAIAGLLMGSTAENIIEKTQTSLLAIKPEGFISPIKPSH
jgi:universal stress protein E